VRIAVAVCNYNRRDLLLASVRSVLAEPAADVRVFAVDNGSTDGSADALEHVGDPRVSVCRGVVNEGSAGGFHRAIARATESGADYVAVVDSDCVVRPGALGALAAVLEGDPGIAIAGPKVYWAKPAGIVQELGAHLDWERAVFHRNHGDHDESRDGRLTATEEVDYVAACCLVARRDAIERFGNMRRDWFLYFDDIEWCTRIKRQGARIVASPAATAVHHGGGVNRTNHVPAYYYWRNRIHFFREYATPSERPRIVRALYAEAVRAMATCTVLNTPNVAAAIRLAVDDAMAGRKGQGEFSGVDLSHDAPLAHVTPAMRDWPVVRVEHVLDDARAIEGRGRAIVLEDGYRKRLPLETALALLPSYERETSRFERIFRPLLADEPVAAA
jgi:GT2 family glycosyltransferase